MTVAVGEATHIARSEQYIASPGWGRCEAAREGGRGLVKYFSYLERTGLVKSLGRGGTRLRA